MCVDDGFIWDGSKFDMCPVELLGLWFPLAHCNELLLGIARKLKHRLLDGLAPIVALAVLWLWWNVFGRHIRIGEFGAWGRVRLHWCSLVSLELKHVALAVCFLFVGSVW